jgi:hypothetical protein
MLRITRREAAEPGLWNFLAIRMAPDYVLWRHAGRLSSAGEAGATNLKRFCGSFHTQAFGRLWWAAELLRNGDDYSPVELGCANQELFQTFLRSDIIHHRPAAQAVARMVSALDTREAVALSKTLNTAGSTLLYETLAPDEEQDVDAHRAWLAKADAAYTPYDSLPDGPYDGRVPGSSVDVLLTLFEKLFAEAPVRGRDRS